MSLYCKCGNPIDLETPRRKGQEICIECLRAGWEAYKEGCKERGRNVTFWNSRKRKADARRSG
jgi:hypothetical protein